MHKKKTGLFIVYSSTAKIRRKFCNVLQIARQSKYFPTLYVFHNFSSDSSARVCGNINISTELRPFTSLVVHKKHT